MQGHSVKAASLTFITDFTEAKVCSTESSDEGDA